MSDTPITIRFLEPHHRALWEPLWQSYLLFYGASLPPTQSNATWRRFHDPSEPVFALGAFDGDDLIGFAHYLFHRSTWAEQHYCYLEDLFTAPAARGQGVGRALIDEVARQAQKAGSARLYWSTHENNAIAQKLYDGIVPKSGFIQYRIKL
jgi:GNAT superfamily N-acetyltransferase